MPFPRLAAFLAIALALIALAPAAGAAKSYRAERFDVSVRVLPGGDLAVTETMTFRFEDGSFTEVFRDVPTRRTDGLSGFVAAMDGQVLPEGREAGQARVARGENGTMRVTWHFAPTERAARTFTLTYRARGVVYREADEDVVRWNALPTKHAYGIDAATLRLSWPEGLRPRQVGAVPWRYDGAPDVRQDAGQMTVSAAGLGRDASLELQARFLRGALVATLPDWQQRDERSAALAPRAIGLAALTLLGLGGVLFLLWVQSPRPAGREFLGSAEEAEPPGDVPVAIAGALASGGRVQALHAMGALMGLAGRGALRIEEREGGRFSGRRFVAVRGTDPPTLAPHEREMLRLVFEPSGAREAEVDLSKVPGRLRRSWRTYREAVNGELRAARLFDPDRARARARLTGVALMVVILGGITVFVPIVLIPKLGPWPIVVPLAALLAGVIGLVLASSISPLTDDGLRQAARWRAFARGVRELSRGKRTAHRSDLFERFLPYAAAFGLAAAWAKRFGTRGVPPWFSALRADDSVNAAFVAMMSSGSFTAQGSGGAGAASAAGGAAGGGASGAS